ncbi:MAG: twin-arginine translocase TatA/TatE family subunit [Acidimicrobiales bacterium]
MILAEIFGVDGIIVIVCVVVVLLFGGTKLPKLARGLGSASHEFKKGLEEGDKDGALPAAGSSSAPAPPAATPEALPKDASTN